MSQLVKNWKLQIDTAINAEKATLASNATAGSGAGKVGFSAAMVYTAGTAGAEMKRLDTLTSDADNLRQLSADLFAGTAATIDAHGDSTMWGADAANVSLQVATPPPTALQNFVGLYLGNSALTVVNKGLGGTTAKQMIAGTDGSGSTFEAKMIASMARAVYCNHGINDAFGSSATSAIEYKNALIAFVRTSRKYGKVPILVTPHITFSYGGFGSKERAEATRYFAQVMRQVAEEYKVELIDQYRYMEGMLSSGKNKPLALSHCN